MIYHQSIECKIPLSSAVQSVGYKSSHQELEKQVCDPYKEQILVVQTFINMTFIFSIWVFP